MRTLPMTAVVLWMLGVVTVTQAEPADYFVAVDSLETLTSGTFAGLPNPNFGRLTLLFAHRSPEDPTQNHFHAIGAYSYVSVEGGPPTVASPTRTTAFPRSPRRSCL